MKNRVVPTPQTLICSKCYGLISEGDLFYGVYEFEKGVANNNRTYILRLCSKCFSPSNYGGSQ